MTPFSKVVQAESRRKERAFTACTTLLNGVIVYLLPINDCCFFFFVQLKASKDKIADLC